MPPVIGTTCSYPTCPSRLGAEPPATERVGAAIRVCPECGVPQAVCRERDCGALNRAAARYCRRCRTELPNGSHPGKEPPAWADSRDSETGKIPTNIGEPVLIATIPPPANPPAYPTRIALAMFEGLIAVDDPGHFRGLARSFSPNSETGWIWSAEQRSGHDEAIRAFAPVALADRRRLAFATTRDVSVIDVWALRRLSACHVDKPEAKLDLAAKGLTLLSSPIPLKGDRVGLIVAKRGDPDHPRWLDWTPGTVPPDDPPRLGEVKGHRCHAVLLGGLILAISTPDGHWVWRHSAAVDGDFPRIRKTWPGRDGDGLRVRERSGNDPEPPAQAFSTIDLDERRERPSFEWYFQAESDDGRDSVRIVNYRVRLDAAETTIPSDFVVKDAEPIGVVDDLLIYRADKESLLRAKPGEPKYRSYPGAMVPSLVSRELRGNLLVMQGARDRSMSRFLKICSLVDHRRSVEVDLGSMRSRPLLWSRWIFTAESNDGVLGIRRREAAFEPSTSMGESRP